MTPSPEKAIHDLICRFMQSFDEKDWRLMRECLDEVIYLDYSSFRNEPPGEVTADSYVAKRKSALNHLKLQHNFTNLIITLDGNTATARCNYQILRFHPDFDKAPALFFHSVGHYQFKFLQRGTTWKINSIQQILLQNIGNPELHTGVRPAAP
jgi:hypothetical protein